MNFRNIKNLSDDIENWLRDLPPGIECVVGIPRSGMLVANILALRLNLPYTDLAGLLTGRLIESGRRLQVTDKGAYLETRRKVLVVDDCVSSGKSMTAVRRQIESAVLPHEVVYACVYKNPKGSGLDWVLAYEALSKPRLFEWNILSVSHVTNACFDLDGVLCRTRIEINGKTDNEARSMIATVEPLYIPQFEIGWIVTTRCERFRAETEAWLRRNKIMFRELIMAEHPIDAGSRDDDRIVRFKAERFSACGAKLFVEKEAKPALEIAEMSQRYVYCCDRRELLRPEGIGFQIHENGRKLSRLLRSFGARLRTGK